MRMKSIHRALAGAAAAALLGLGLSVPVTQAQTTPPPNTAEINPATTVSLTVHKHEGPAVNCPNDGTDQSACVTAAGSAALAGAEFSATPVLWDQDGTGTTYSPVAIDLSTAQGWALASDFIAHWTGSTTLPTPTSPLTGTYSWGTPIASAATNASGITTFTTGMTQTLYVVKETKAPTASTGAAYTMASPFAITLPRSTTDGKSWIYDVHVFPKNMKSTASKVVIDDRTAGVDSGTSASNTVTYKVTTSIEPGYVQSTATSGTVLTKYQVYDTFDARLTPPTAAQVVVQITTATGTPTTLALTTDYTVTVSGQKVTVDFTTTGLDKLVAAKAADSTAQVLTTFPTTLTDSHCYAAPVTAPQIECSATMTDGVIKNTAYFVPSQFAVDAQGNPVGTPTNTVESKYNNVKILKQNSADTTKLLTGAEFELYQISGTTCSATTLAAELAASPITAFKIDTAITDATGEILWPSLKTSSRYNDSVTSTNRNYCIVEITPPPGYMMPANPYTYFNLPDPTAGVLAFEVEITNVEEPGNELPLTGGAGVAAISIFGLLLIGGGLGYYIITTRRRREADNH